MRSFRTIARALPRLELVLAGLAVTGSLVALQSFTEPHLRSIVLGVLGSLVGAALSVSLSLAATRRSKHPRVFISYVHEDANFAATLASALASLGAKPILDRDALRVGDRVESTVGQLIDQADYVVFIASNASRQSSWAHKELQESFRRRKRVLPVVLQRDSIPEELRGVYYADFTGDPNRGFAELARVIRPGKAESTRDARTPYPVGRD